MSLFIEVYVGSEDRRKLVAKCVAHNVSNLAHYSDYDFVSEEFGAPHLDIPPTKSQGTVKNHNRKTTVWHLVRELAAESW